MKLYNVPLDQVAWNPWRDKTLYPINEEHLTELRESIRDHEFFVTLKGRRKNGMIEIACGHARLEAAKKLKLETIPVFIDEIDEDEMLRLMTDENATQAGSNPGAVMNEVAAVTRRLIEGLLGTNVPSSLKKALGNETAIELAQGRLRKRQALGEGDIPLGHNVIRAYLGQGKIERSHRTEREVREAIAALKQSGRYDDLIEKTLLKYPPATDAKPSKSTAVAKSKPTKPRHRSLDERCASLFQNEAQFRAFREAIRTAAAQKAIPVDQQYPLAKSIMANAKNDPKFKSKNITGPHIKNRVQQHVQDYLKQQRAIDKEEHDRYIAEEIDRQIDDAVKNTNRWVRALIDAILKLITLAEKYPGHQKLGGVGPRLDDLGKAIKQFNQKCK